MELKNLPYSTLGRWQGWDPLRLSVHLVILVFGIVVLAINWMSITSFLPLRMGLLSKFIAILRSANLAQANFYDGFTTEALIPFSPNDANEVLPFTEVVRVDIRIGSGNATADYQVIVDTGTCGYIISTDRIPSWPPANLSSYPVGWEFLSSSKKLYSGHWIPQDILFTKADVEVKARIPVLAVEDTVICSNYNQTTDTNSCPTPTSGTPPVVTHLPQRISLFGIGFGRQHDGQPQGNPDKNPFLNIISIDGVSTSNSTFRDGYTITSEGVTVGLTESNTAGMLFVDLMKGLSHTTYPMDWLPVPACIAVDNMTCVAGTALFDTGISQAYLTLPTGSKVKRHTAQSPSSGAIVSVLDDGSFVQLSFGSGTAQVLDSFYVVNSTTTTIVDQTPDMVITTLANPDVKAPFINTGAHFFRGWNVAFDAVGGHFGFRKVHPTRDELL